MPKGPYLTPRIRTLIADIYIEDCAIGPTKAREELLKRMKAEGLDTCFGPDYPGVSAVSKELKQLRQVDGSRPSKAKELDRPWHLLTLATYDISPEAIPYVMRVQATRIQIGFPLTIREARWVARLSLFVDSMIQKPLKKRGTIDVLLMSLSVRYARGERILELLGGAGLLPNDETQEWVCLHEDSGTYAYVTGDKKPHEATSAKLAEIAPDLYQDMTAEDDDDRLPEQIYEEFIERLEKETK